MYRVAPFLQPRTRGSHADTHALTQGAWPLAAPTRLHYSSTSYTFTRSQLTFEEPEVVEEAEKPKKQPNAVPTTSTGSLKVACTLEPSDVLTPAPLRRRSVN